MERTPQSEPSEPNILMDKIQEYFPELLDPIKQSKLLEANGLERVIINGNFTANSRETLGIKNTKDNFLIGRFEEGLNRNSIKLTHNYELLNMDVKILVLTLFAMHEGGKSVPHIDAYNSFSRDDGLLYLKELYGIRSPHLARLQNLIIRTIGAQ